MIELGKYVITAENNCYSVGEKRFRVNDDKKGHYKRGDQYVHPLEIRASSVHDCVKALIWRLQWYQVRNVDMTLYEAAEIFQAIEKDVYEWAKIEGYDG